MNAVTVTFDNNDLQALSALLDAGVKATGLSSVKAAASLLVKLETAIADINKSTPQENDLQGS